MFVFVAGKVTNYFSPSQYFPANLVPNFQQHFLEDGGGSEKGDITAWETRTATRRGEMPARGRFFPNKWPSGRKFVNLRSAKMP